MKLCLLDLALLAATPAISAERVYFYMGHEWRVWDTEARQWLARRPTREELP